MDNYSTYYTAITNKKYTSYAQTPCKQPCKIKTKSSVDAYRQYSVMHKVILGNI